MQSSIHITTKILPGNKIEIQIPEASIGDTVDVFIVFPNQSESNRVSAIDLIEQIRSKISFRTSEDINKQLQDERNSWDN